MRCATPMLITNKLNFKTFSSIFEMITTLYDRTMIEKISDANIIGYFLICKFFYNFFLINRRKFNPLDTDVKPINVGIVI